MARMGAIAQRAENLLGAAVVATTPVAGGDICTSTRLRLSDGRSALVKTRPHPPASRPPSTPMEGVAKYHHPRTPDRCCAAPSRTPGSIDGMQCRP